MNDQVKSLQKVWAQTFLLVTKESTAVHLTDVWQEKVMKEKRKIKR